MSGPAPSCPLRLCAPLLVVLLTGAFACRRAPTTAADAGVAAAFPQRTTRTLADDSVAEVETRPGALPGTWARTWTVGKQVVRSELFLGQNLVQSEEFAPGRSELRWFHEDGGLWRERIDTAEPLRRVVTTEYAAGRAHTRQTEAWQGDGSLRLTTETPTPDGGWDVQSQQVVSIDQPRR